jgi:lipid II:glycine glycyltransferase (peptidoglycan interpeptide bridge formation enzyme)
MISGKVIDHFKGTFEIFQDPGFVEIFARRHNLQILDLDGLIVLLAKSRLLGYTNGILGSPEVFGPFDKWWGKIKRLNYAYLKIHTTQKVDSFNRYCISPEDNHNMVNDLSIGEENLFKQFTKKCRETVRSGRKKKVFVREGQDEKDLKRFYQISTKISDSGRKFELLPYDLIKDLFFSLYGKLLLAIGQDQIIGGYFFLLTRSNMFAWMGGIDRDFVHLTPGNLMLFESMKWGIANGYRFFDMGQQSLSENPNLTRYKMSFNPLLKPAYTYNVPKSKMKILLSNIKNHIIPSSEE